ncbi:MULTISPECIES: hypothetical protein [unclassified Shewanella]|uniref:hypothetical protein n=1 Tax=unclassified Shewanella TaxID=196818 RepID=UPI001A7E4B64|nr:MULTISPECIES: hypothetical protein [unclassified Shewanella]GCF88768.1 hypothetical protein SMBr_10120 [Shewanella sp. M-Br]
MANSRCGGDCRLLPTEKEKIAALAWEKLAPALNDDLRIIQSEVQQGVAQLIAWGDCEFFTVVRGETAANGKELVIVAAAGKNSVHYLETIHTQAKAQGFASVRFHTKRPEAMLRMGKVLGYEKAETILRAVL